MPLAHPTHVVSFSSEDPNNPASNLLNRETFRKWKCKEPGEKEAFVILKFDKAVTINCIDIGNDGSALVEVSVARSGSGGEPEFEVLLGSTAFMSPLDSREGKNTNGVKSFSINSLSKPVAAQKWDLVKIQVTQPFNRHVQYGLTFIKFMVAPDPNEPEKIGIFGLRKPIGGDDSDDDDLKPGSLFSRKISSNKNKSVQKLSSSLSTLSTNAEIRQTSAKIASAAKSGTDAETKDLLRNKPKMDLPVPSPSSSDKKQSGKDDTLLLSRKKLSDTPIRSNKDNKDNKDNDNKSTTPKSKTTTVPSKNLNGSSGKKRALSPDTPTRTGGKASTPVASTSKSSSTPAKKLKKARKTKPFNKLMEGVVFSMSGFENPLRGQLRDNAIEMGARYKADWDASCTHLICAFYNTPKFRSVRTAGNGKIVKKDWIEKCYTDKCHYPWRRHCLDKNDGKESESEEEIYAEGNNNGEEFMDDDVVDTAESEKNDQINGKTKRKRVMRLDSSDEEEKEKSDDNDSKKAYDADTDVDEDRTPDLSPSIMDTHSDTSPIFEKMCFHVSASSDSNDNSKIEEIVKRRKGTLSKSPDDHTEYYVCHTYDWDDDFADYLSDNPNLVFIHKNWVLECDRADELVEKDQFVISS